MTTWTCLYNRAAEKVLSDCHITAALLVIENTPVRFNFRNSYDATPSRTFPLILRHLQLPHHGPCHGPEALGHPGDDRAHGRRPSGGPDRHAEFRRGAGSYERAGAGDVGPLRTISEGHR